MNTLSEFFRIPQILDWIEKYLTKGVPIMNEHISQNMVIFRLSGYPPNEENFTFQDGEIESNNRCVALLKLNDLGYRVLQMEINVFNNGSNTGEWWLVEKYLTKRGKK